MCAKFQLSSYKKSAPKVGSKLENLSVEISIAQYRYLFIDIARYFDVKMQRWPRPFHTYQICWYSRQGNAPNSSPKDRKRSKKKNPPTYKRPQPLIFPAEYEKTRSAMLQPYLSGQFYRSSELSQLVVFALKNAMAQTLILSPQSRSHQYDFSMSIVNYSSFHSILGFLPPWSNSTATGKSGKINALTI